MLWLWNGRISSATAVLLVLVRIEDAAPARDGGLQGQRAHRLRPHLESSYAEVEQQVRKLQQRTSINGSTLEAPSPYGLSLCFDETGSPLRIWCSVGCPSRFYTVHGTGETMTASTCGGASFNTCLIVREGSTNSSCALLNCAGHNDQFCGDQSKVTWHSETDKTYHIQVTGWDSGWSLPCCGTFTLQVGGTDEKLIEMDMPNCVGGLSTSITGNIEGALSPNANPPCPNEFGNADGVNGYPSLWYVVIGTGARMFATTCDPATGWDTRLVIYKGNCDDMACVGSNDNGCGYTRSSLSWDSVEGATYHIQVTGWAIVYADWRFKLRVDGTDAPLTQTEICTDPPACRSVTYWVLEGSRSRIKRRARQLKDITTTCIVHPSNIEVRPTCTPPAVPDLPVRIRLLNKNGRVICQRSDPNPPFRLWVGRDGGSPRQLRNGVYYLESNAAAGVSRIQFTQACPPNDCQGRRKKGLKGCRNL